VQVLRTGPEDVAPVRVSFRHAPIYSRRRFGEARRPRKPSKADDWLQAESRRPGAVDGGRRPWWHGMLDYGVVRRTSSRFDSVRPSVEHRWILAAATGRTTLQNLAERA